MNMMTAPSAVTDSVALNRFDAAALVARIDQARHLFSAGDMRAALVAAEAAYEESKGAHQFASRMKASEEVIARAQAMAAEALEIGSFAKVALANDYDKAVASGLVASRGRPKKVAGRDLFQLSDFGLDKYVIAEARKLRDVEQGSPGAIIRAIAGISASGVLPTRNGLRAAIGTASAGKDARGDNFYQTPDVATITLLALESFSATVCDPACGYNAIGRVCEGRGYDVVLSDIVDRGTVSEAGNPQSVGDFLLSQPMEDGDFPDIITNPPYGEVLNGFVAHALRVIKPRKMALLLNLNFQCGFADEDRSFVMDENPPSRVYAFKRRLPMMHREDYEGPKAASRMNTGWFVWERNEDGTYGDRDGWMKTRRVDWAEFADDDALDPGEGGNCDGINFDASRTTPKLELHERVDRDRDDARAWILQNPEFDRAELCRGIGRRDSTVEALLSEFVAAGLISPASEPGRRGRHSLLEGLTG